MAPREHVEPEIRQQSAVLTDPFQECRNAVYKRTQRSQRPHPFCTSHVGVGGLRGRSRGHTELGVRADLR